MNASRLPWILLGLLAGLFVLFMGAATILVGTDLIKFRNLGESDALATATASSTALVPGTGIIEGLVWHDMCASGSEGQPVPLDKPAGCVPASSGGYGADGVRESEEPGLGNLTVQLGQGACPATGLATQLTRADGYFFFDRLYAGTYCVSVDSLQAANSGALLPGGWTSPLTASTQAGITITLADGERRGNVEFGWDYQFLPVPPTPTATPTVTLTPTPSITPTATAVPIPCDWAAFVKDVTVPDGTTFSPDKDFKKTWQIKNIGTCTWTKDYALVFESGNRMTGDKVTRLGTSVAPGKTIDISIELTSPVETGKHVGYWALRNASGKVFGIGPKAQDPFWVQIQVIKPKKVLLDMVSEACSATWRSDAGEIPCPTNEYSIDGFIQKVENPILEGGRVENEPGLWVIPEGVNDGWIEGIYAPLTIQSGDQFKTLVSCWDEAPLCDVEFRLLYKSENGEIKTLGKWIEKYEGSYTKVNLDLSALRGQTVQFILRVSVRDVFDQESAIWLVPAIWR